MLFPSTEARHATTIQVSKISTYCNALEKSIKIIVQFWLAFKEHLYHLYLQNFPNANYQNKITEQK